MKKILFFGLLAISLILSSCSSSIDPSLKQQLFEVADDLPDAHMLKIMASFQNRVGECVDAVEEERVLQGQEVFPEDEKNRIRECRGDIRKEIIKKDKNMYVVEFHVDYPSSCNIESYIPVPLIANLNIKTEEAEVFWAIGNRPSDEVLAIGVRVMQAEDCKGVAEIVVGNASSSLEEEE